MLLLLKSEYALAIWLFGDLKSTFLEQIINHNHNYNLGQSSCEEETSSTSFHITLLKLGQ